MTLKQKLKTLYQRAYKDKLKLFRRTIRTSLKDPNLALDYLRFRRLTAKKHWKLAQPMLDKIGGRAVRIKDARLVKEVAEASLRLGDQVSYTKWQVESAKIDGNFRPDDWSGENLSNATLWVSFRETEKQGLSDGLNLTGYVKKASSDAKYTVLVVSCSYLGTYNDDVLAVIANSSYVEFTLGDLYESVVAETLPPLPNCIQLM